MESLGVASHPLQHPSAFQYGGRVPCSACLGFLLRFFTKLNNFKADQIFPAIDPDIEQRTIVRFHQLKASIAILLNPAIDVNQSVREHSSFLVEALVNLRFRTGREVLDDHISLHDFQSLTRTS